MTSMLSRKMTLTTTMLNPLPDIQDLPDTRGIAIQQVGIRDLHYPIQIVDQHNHRQSSIGNFSLSIGLAATQKGAHLSRFVEILESYPRCFGTDGEGLAALLANVQTKLGAEHAFVELSFPFFLKKMAPHSGQTSLMDYQIAFSAEKKATQPVQFSCQVKVPVTSVCPCSRAISNHGAHNQRSLLMLCVKTNNPIPAEQWIRLLEQQGSAELYALLKRPDEKHVTEQAYENAKFVEDIVRDAALMLNQDTNVVEYSLLVENLESIHNHVAFAKIKGL